MFKVEFTMRFKSGSIAGAEHVKTYHFANRALAQGFASFVKLHEAIPMVETGGLKYTCHNVEVMPVATQVEAFEMD